MLGGGVRAHVRGPVEPGERGDVDHASPAALEHRGQDGAREHIGPGRVDAQVTVPEGRLGLRDGRRLGDPRVVDEDVDCAERGADIVDRPRDGVGVAHVQHERHRLHAEPAEGIGGRLHLIGRSRTDRDVTAFAGQRERDFSTDAATAAGDKGDPRHRCVHGLSTQNKKMSGRLVDRSSRTGSDRQRTRGELLLWAPPSGGAVAHPARIASQTSSTIERRDQFMRPFYRGIGYI